MYDLVILDTTLSRSRELLDFAVNRPFPVPVAIVAPSLASPETLKLTKEAGAKVAFSMGKLDGIVPVLEYIVWREQLPPLARFFENVRQFVNRRPESTHISGTYLTLIFIPERLREPTEQIFSPAGNNLSRI